MEVTVVGDIHGEMNSLKRFLSSDLAKRKDVILLGDLVNKGKNSNKVLDLLIEHNNKLNNLILLKSNHDQFLLNYLETGNFFEYGIRGGISTIKSYVPKPTGDLYQIFLKSFPPHHKKFLNESFKYWENEKYFLSHCGISPSDPYDRSIEALCFKTHRNLFKSNFDIGKLVICGHYVQMSEEPYISENLVCIDTGCGTIGRTLTVMTLPENEFYQFK